MLLGLLLILALSAQARLATSFQSSVLSKSSDSAILYGTALEGDLIQKLYLFRVNQSSGVCTNVTLLEAYSTDLTDMSMDLSAVDQKQGLYYYATNFLTPLLYIVDLTNGEILAPIDLSVYLITNIVINPSTSEAVISVFPTTNSPPQILGFSFPGGPVRVIIDLQTTHYREIFAGTFDEVKNIFYLTATTNSTSGQFDLLAINPQNGHIIRKQTINGCGKPLMPMYMHYDSQTKMIYIGAFALHQEISWALLTVDPVSGTCIKQPMAYGDSILACWTYDPTSKNLYYTYDVNEISYINIVTGAKGPVLGTCNLLNMGAYFGAAAVV